MLNRRVAWVSPCLWLLIGCMAGTANTARSADHPAPPQPDDRPNLVLILTDDQGYGDVAVHGNPYPLHTPNMDRLARQGVWFDRFYVSPVCAPTRAALLTGRYPQRVGVTGVSRGAENMNPGEVTLADIFKANGYATGCFGKWHNGSYWPYHPNARGFDQFFGFACGHWANYFDTHLEHNGQPVRTSGYINDVLTDAALAFIDAHRDRPFFCYLPLNTPHTPWQVPQDDYDRVRRRLSGQVDDPRILCAYAMCENIDRQVGRILQRLESIGLARRTLVIFLSDNGPNGHRWNASMKGIKGSVDEGGVRVPCYFYWPGRLQARKIDTIAAHVDLLPTLVELLGLQPLKTRPLDGRSLVPLLEGRCGDWPDRVIINAWGRRISVRSQRYRADEKALYDMQADPGQQHNIAADKPDVHARFLRVIERFRSENPPVERDPHIPVGYDQFPRVELKSQESSVAMNRRLKGIGLSSIHPNSSFITRWTDPAQTISWPIRVVQPGRYELTLYYCCPAESVGTKFTVTCAGRRIQAELTVAHDPPLLPSPDRAPRSESYEKVFKPLKLGRMDLPAGPTELVIAAQNKPGPVVMDVQMVVIEKR